MIVWLVEPLRLLHGEMGPLKQPAHPEPCLSYAHLSLQWMLPVEVFCLGALVITPKDSSRGRVLSDVAPKAASGVGSSYDSSYDSESHLRRSLI